MAGLLLQVLPLALGAAVSPTVLAVSVLVLSSPKRAVARTLALLAGCGAVLLAIGIPGIIFFAGLHLRPRNHTSLDAGLDLAFGVLLLALGARRWSKRPTAQEKHGSRVAKLKDAGPRAYFVVGLVLMLTNFTTLAIYLPLLKDLARSTDGFTNKLAILLVSDLIILSVVIVPMLVRVVAPTAAAKGLAAVNELVSKYSRVMMTVLILAFGAYLTVKGIRGL